MKKIVLAACAAATLCVPASAGAHATVNAMQPQGKTLTAARQAYVLRVPNEEEKTSTYQVTLFVPPAVQSSIAVMKKPGWRITMKRTDAGTTKITWRARNGSSAIDPHYYDEFPVRWQNPAAAQRVCFWIYQTYGTQVHNSRTDRMGWSKSETVKWSGPASSETPASCLTFTES